MVCGSFDKTTKLGVEIAAVDIPWCGIKSKMSQEGNLELYAFAVKRIAYHHWGDSEATLLQACRRASILFLANSLFGSALEKRHPDTNWLELAENLTWRAFRQCRNDEKLGRGPFKVEPKIPS